MNFIGHSTGGLITAGISGCYFFNSTNSFKIGLTSAITTYIFSLYPDMDIRSTSRKLLTVAGLIATIALYIINPIFSIVMLSLTLFPRLLPHRGFNHSLIMMCIVAVIWNTMFPGTVWAVMIGFLTHLVLDTHFKLV